MAKYYVLNDRQKDVFNTIIISHVKTAAPIGSAFVSNILGLSSATIRNVMGELEDMGYLCKPHTSAGRVPTTEGYRYYVNKIVNLSDIPERDKRFIQEESNKVVDSIEVLLERVSHLLAELTGQAGIACISHLKFYIEGTSHMVDMPEFRNPEKIRLILRLFDERDELIRLLNEDLTTDGVKIHISEEDRFDMLRDLSVITSNYRVGKSRKGSLGVIGPVRMNYPLLIPLVDFLSRTIETALDEMETLL